MTAPTPPTGGALTGAGYTLTNGVYSKTFGTIVVNFIISGEPDTGTCFVNTGGDVSATDVANASASLASLGYNLNTASASGTGASGGNVSLSAAGGCTYYGQTL